MQTLQAHNKSSSDANLNPTQTSSLLPKTPPSPFSPLLIPTTLKVEANYGFQYTCVCFHPKHNLIIACPGGRSMHFYDATTLLPLKERETQKLDGIAMQISFHPEADTYLIGCTGGLLYMYNASRNELIQLKQCEQQVHAVTFLNPIYYVYSYLGSKNLVLRALENENIAITFDSKNSEIFCLENLSERKILLAGLIGGYVMIYRTDKLPRLQVYCSVLAHLAGRVVFTAKRIKMNRKEYVITGGKEAAVKIWHLVKGRMRLLKVIGVEVTPILSVVYLEDYKMLAIASEGYFVQFVRLLSGKSESKIYLSERDSHCLVEMKEKNMVGVTSYQESLIEFIQLSRP